MRAVAMRVAGAALLLTSAASLRAAGAQDIEVRATLSGRALPEAYFERIRHDPGTFELRAGWRRRTEAAMTFQSAVQGTLPIAVIPARFATSGPTPAALSSASLQHLLFDGPAEASVTGFYAEISRGRITMRGRVASWVQTPLSISEVTGTSSGLGAGARVGDWLRAAVAAADAEIDFTQFDNDGPDGVPNSGDDDGKVDGAAFLFQEVDAACGGPGIWPHRARVSIWGGTPAVTDDIGANGTPIIIDDYIILGASDCSGAGPLESNVFAHEMGHVLGLPDYYDSRAGRLREERRWIVGCWDLMSAGAWGCGSGPQPSSLRPTHMGPLPKAALNWVTPIVLASDLRDAEFTLRPVRTSGDVLQIPLGVRQFLLVEYRDRGGFDAGLPAQGVLVYHVETDRAFLPCATCPQTYAYSLLEADGNDGLRRTELEFGNRGEAGDAFTTGKSLTNTTSPAPRLLNGTPTSVTIHSITVDAASGVARLRISTAPVPALVAGSAPAPVGALLPAAIELRAAGGALPYEWSVAGLPPGLRLATHGDRALIEGSPTAAGTYPVTVSLRDARQVAAEQQVTLTVAGAPVITAARLLASLSGGGGTLSPAEREFLDAQGNRNGRFDIGDVRAYLSRMPR